MILKRCVIELTIQGHKLYVSENLDPVKEIKDAKIFIGKHKTKRICDIIKTDKRIKTKIIDLGGQ